MKRILLWSVIPPFNEYSANEILARNMLGSNTGNLLFHYSAARALMTQPDTAYEIQFSSFGDRMDEIAARVNAQFDCFVIPLANAFRADYIPKLNALTQFVRKLKIPCVVIGVGVQASSMEKLREGFAFDAAARDFVGAVLDHSALIGTRGTFTNEYLKHLGFSEERHFTAIGCPSMYMFGSDLPETVKKPLTAESKVSVNGKIESPAAIHALIARGCEELPNYWYVPQRIEELWMMHAGMPILRRRKWNLPEYIPVDFNNRLLREKRSVAFLNVPTWLEFMRGMDFSYGCNIHGNIAAYLAGVPGLVIARDLRVAELANYFEIPMVSQEELESRPSIREAYERADFSKVKAGHERRFAHYVDFLNANGLDHIFKNGGSVQDAPYDQRVAQLNLAPPVYPRIPLSFTQRLECMPIYKSAARHYWIKYNNKRKARRKK